MPFFPHRTLWRLLALDHVPAWWEIWTALACATWTCFVFEAHPLAGIPITLIALVAYLAARGLHDWHTGWTTCDDASEES